MGIEAYFPGQSFNSLSPGLACVLIRSTGIMYTTNIYVTGMGPLTVLPTLNQEKRFDQTLRFHLGIYIRELLLYIPLQ